MLEETGKADLLRRLGNDFSLLQSHWQQPTDSQWQMLVFPILYEGQAEQARLFVRRDRQGGGGAEGEAERTGTRFIVEIGLSNLGEMQMDGLVRRQQQSTLFDLIIRSHTPLAEDIQRDIQAIFQNAAELTGYKGGVSFQAAREFPVKPEEEYFHSRAGDVTI